MKNHAYWADLHRKALENIRKLHSTWHAKRALTHAPNVHGVSRMKRRTLYCRWRRLLTHQQFKERQLCQLQERVAFYEARMAACFKPGLVRVFQGVSF